MYAEILALLIRHGLTALGMQVAVSSGEVDVQAVSGAVLTIGGLGWSAWRKWQRQGAQ